MLPSTEGPSRKIVHHRLTKSEWRSPENLNQPESSCMNKRIQFEELSLGPQNSNGIQQRQNIQQTPAQTTATHWNQQRSLLAHKSGITDGNDQTDNDTKLLYCEIFRRRMSQHGPSTRSNLSRSILTHLSTPLATTVAARGRFSRRAISPENQNKIYVFK